MNPSDIYAVLQWWLVLFLLGIGFAPLTFWLFPFFFDKGYLFSKIIGLLLVGYVVFVLGAFHILPFTYPVILSVTIALPIVTFFLVPQKWKVIYVLNRTWFTLVAEELFFLMILFIWAYIHSFAPDIHGLEKFMDYGFINSFLRSDYLPAKDMWFTPFMINYYYFGHLLTAMLTKLSGLSSAVTFNLMLSTIMAFCFTETFSIGANLYSQLAKSGRLANVKLIFSGILTACLVTLAGNLHLLYGFFKPYKTDNPVPLWELPFKPFSFPNEYWYPNATRFIFHTIHEFPIYSWVVADLHGHVLDIPFVLLTIALLLSLILIHNQPIEDEKTIIQKTFQIHPAHLLFIGLLLACMYMTNAWDGAIYWLLSAAVILTIHGFKRPIYKKFLGEEEEPFKVIPNNKKDRHRFKMPEKWQIIWGRDLLLSVLLITAALFLFTTPYNIHFKPFASGIGVLCAPDFLTHIGKIGPFLFEAQHCQRSYWWELLTLYGFFFFFVAVFATFILRSKRQNQTDVFVLLLIMISTFLIIIPEFFYLKDIYPAHFRANTMFKLVFQAFIMLGISSSYIIVRLATNMADIDWRRRLYTLCFLLTSVILVTLVMIYPYLAVNAYYNNFKSYQGLDGVHYLKTLYPNDYAAVQWINEYIKGQPVILEAQGDSYTDYARISANTGLPTVLGWTVHEWLWRGTYDIPAPRINEIKTMYETSEVQTAKNLLNTYKVKYVYIGNLEYQKYPKLDEQKFEKLGHIVFQQENTKIYELN